MMINDRDVKLLSVVSYFEISQKHTCNYTAFVIFYNNLPGHYFVFDQTKLVTLQNLPTRSLVDVITGDQHIT